MFFLLLSVVPVSASVFGQDAKVSLQVEKASLEKVMSILERGRRECRDCSVGRETTGAKGEQERKTSERTGYG